MSESFVRTKVTASEYRGWPSIVLETELMRVELIPGLGAKLVSLRYKATGKEWLVDAGSRALRQPAYGSSFGQADMSGWDECFPTIDPCTVGADNIFLPDHGELWALPWTAEANEESVTCSVQGVALPYLFSRNLRFSSADTLRMNYRVANLGDRPFPYLWVPHPQFAVTEPTRIELPPSEREAEAVCVFGGLHHVTGERYRWDELTLVGERQNGDGRKYYAPGRWEEGWCGLSAPISGNWLRLQVDPREVPYFGVWIDEGMGNDRNAIALEPSIGYYDSLERAAENGSAPSVAPGSSHEWSLELRLGVK
ncbi:hypothetical protein [Cohnella sp. AR92]|uniref:hypothetical protein n=1 Tax=Cohnella sp. AR92 TaxID=648716 RepID=UPI000F8DFE1E|nr:hypothetical protein [Cohnella sp. AR92]RUS45580.1 hypothetical protein ELR57_19735 [Cohnella sp. AR92]